MSDTKTILDAVGRLRRAGEPFLVATVARVRGSSYRRPGARMLLTRDRWIAGSVSGGCLEGDVVRKGWWRIREGEPILVTYDATAEDEEGSGFGLGCDGVVDVLLESAGEEGRLDAFDFLATCVAAQRKGALATALGTLGGRVALGARLALGTGGVADSDIVDSEVKGRFEALCRVVLRTGETRVVACTLGGTTIDVLVEAILPPPRLFVLGTGHDAVPVVTFARALGWEVIVWEPRARLSTRERFADADGILATDTDTLRASIDASDRAAVVVMAHDYERDRASLKMLLGTRAEYIGMLGPRRRTMRMLEELGMSARDPRLHAPVGLELGAETPQEIALAITAEVQSVLTRASGSSLCERVGSIHTSDTKDTSADAAE